jgi:hypothetical protein
MHNGELQKMSSDTQNQSSQILALVLGSLTFVSGTVAAVGAIFTGYVELHYRSLVVTGGTAGVLIALQIVAGFVLASRSWHHLRKKK